VDFRAAGARPREPVHARSSCARSARATGKAARRRGPLRPPVLLSSWLPELRPVSLGARQGSTPVAQPVADLRRVRAAAVLPPLRARFLRADAQAVPQRGRVLRTAVGPRRVLAVDVFRETVTLRTEGGDTRVVSLEKLKAKPPERMPKFYLTTAIDYSNGEPHLGARAREDRRRLHRALSPLRGDDVHFLMGMDEHSQSVIQAAARAGSAHSSGRPHGGHLRRLLAPPPLHERRLDPLPRSRARPCGGGAAGADPAAPPGGSVRGGVRRAVLHGCEEFKTGAQIVDGIAWSIPHSADPDQGAESLLPPERVSRTPSSNASLGRAERAARDPPHEVLRLLEAGLQDISISRQRQPWGIPFPATHSRPYTSGSTR